MTVVVNDESKHSTFSRINIVICFIPCGGPTVICFIPCGSRAADPLDGHRNARASPHKYAASITYQAGNILADPGNRTFLITLRDRDAARGETPGIPRRRHRPQRRAAQSHPHANVLRVQPLPLLFIVSLDCHRTERLHALKNMLLQITEATRDELTKITFEIGKSHFQTISIPSCLVCLARRHREHIFNLTIAECYRYHLFIYCNYKKITNIQTQGDELAKITFEIGKSHFQTISIPSCLVCLARRHREHIFNLTIAECYRYHLFIYCNYKKITNIQTQGDELAKITFEIGKSHFQTISIPSCLVCLARRHREHIFNLTIAECYRYHLFIYCNYKKITNIQTQGDELAKITFEIGKSHFQTISIPSCLVCLARRHREHIFNLTIAECYRYHLFIYCNYKKITNIQTQGDELAKITFEIGKSHFQTISIPSCLVCLARRHREHIFNLTIAECYGYHLFIYCNYKKKTESKGNDS
ncbi:hypothetical protein J6590_058094 [Homalodisca vitripennis]|nr:hypothetical protein J6590_058094 [Homalodisca vitripennis]